MATDYDIRSEFYKRVGRSENGCLEWAGAMHEQGYGMFWYRPTEKRGIGNWKAKKAHRMAWELEHGAIPDGLCVCHTCDNRKCVDVKHLWLGTNTDNTHDMISKGRDRKARGEANRSTPFTEQDVRSMRQAYAAGVKQTELAKRFNTYQGTVGRIVRRETWGHVE